MNTKPYLTAILFFAAIFLSGFSGSAQNSADTIRIEKNGLGYMYSKDNVTLYVKQIRALTASNPEARKLLEEYDYRRISSYGLAILGGGCIGWALGDVIGSSMYGNPIHKPVFFSLLGAGAVFMGGAIASDAIANHRLKAAVVLYNKSQRENNNTKLDLGFSPNGVNLRLNF